MTTPEFLEYCRGIHNADSDSFWSDTEIIGLINARIKEITSVLGLVPATAVDTSVIGTQAYNFPTDFQFIEHMLYDGNPIGHINFRQWETRKLSGITPTGTPKHYVIWNRQVLLVPTPVAAGDDITFYGYKSPSTLTGIADAIDIPEALHYRLADGVIGDMFVKDQNVQLAGRYEQKWISVHIPAIYEYKTQMEFADKYPVVTDSESSIESQYGVV